MAAVRRVWPALLDAVRAQSRATQVLFSNATPTAVQGGTLVLTLPTAPLARRLGEERNIEMIKQALHAVLGVGWQVRCEHAGTGAAGAERPASPQGAPRAPTPRRDLPAPAPAPGGEDETMPAETVEAEGIPAERRDPEEVALQLLAEQLGARRVDE